jgi:hypothetical protein
VEGRREGKEKRMTRAKERCIKELKHNTPQDLLVPPPLTPRRKEEAKIGKAGMAENYANEVMLTFARRPTSKYLYSSI